MNRRTQMAGVRLGLTYAAAIVLLGLLVAMLNGSGAGGVQPETRQAGLSGRRVQTTGRAVFDPADAARFGFTAAPAHTGPAPYVPAAPDPQGE